MIKSKLSKDPLCKIPLENTRKGSIIALMEDGVCYVFTETNRKDPSQWEL